MRSNIPDQTRRAEYEGFHTHALLDLAEYARHMDVQLVVESITRYISNYLNTVPETARYLRGLDQPNLKLHIDTHSMNIEDTDLSAAVLAGAAELGYVHFSDSNRRFPGAGNIDFKPMVKKLLDIGYDGIITSECLPWPDAETAARQGLAYMKALEACVQVESWRDPQRGVACRHLSEV
jgi:sugar phosphate isomerase/epimerase